MRVVSALGALWAYYPKGQVRFLSEPGATTIYLRGARKLESHRCRMCGLTTHWVNRDSTLLRMGVNARLLPRNVRDRQIPILVANLRSCDRSPPGDAESATDCEGI